VDIHVPRFRIHVVDYEPRLHGVAEVDDLGAATELVWQGIFRLREVPTFPRDCHPNTIPDLVGGMRMEVLQAADDAGACNDYGHWLDDNLPIRPKIPQCLSHVLSPECEFLVPFWEDISHLWQSTTFVVDHHRWNTDDESSGFVVCVCSPVEESPILLH
jgi:hypothetical protein